MKPFVIAVLLAVLALPAMAMDWDEGVDGDLSSDPNNPTPLAFASFNTVTGTTTANDRDYITFSVPAGHSLTALNLIAFSPDNIAFAAFNTGTTSYIPSVLTDPNFLAGIHVWGGNVGSDLMPIFVGGAVTSNSLPAPKLDAGDYCFVIQQANTVLTSYTLEFVLDLYLPTEESTWGAIKALYEE